MLQACVAGMCNMLVSLDEDDGPIPELVDEESDDEETPPRAHSSLLFPMRNVMRLETGISDDSGLRERFTVPNYSGLELAIPGQVGHSYERYDAAGEQGRLVSREGLDNHAGFHMDYSNYSTRSYHSYSRADAMGEGDAFTRVTFAVQFQSQSDEGDACMPQLVLDDVEALGPRSDRTDKC